MKPCYFALYTTCMEILRKHAHKPMTDPVEHHDNRDDLVDELAVTIQKLLEDGSGTEWNSVIPTYGYSDNDCKEPQD